ncbi:MAG: hypothetical protein ACRD3A_05075 [Terriglobales bacterium]
MADNRYRWLGWAILLTLALYAASRGPLLPEMLWSCHAATALVGLGLILGSRRLVAAGFLFHAALGFPGFLMLVAAKQWISVGSAWVHVLPLAAGGAYLRGRELPRATVLDSWLILPVMIPLSYWLTPAWLNVNLSHGPWEPVAAYFPNRWSFYLPLGLVNLAALALIRAILNRLWGRTEAEPIS